MQPLAVWKVSITWLHVIVTEAQTSESSALISNSSFTMEKITTWQGFVIIKLDDTYVNLPNNEYSSNDVSLTLPQKRFFHSDHLVLLFISSSVMTIYLPDEAGDNDGNLWLHPSSEHDKVGNEVWICSINNGFYSSEILNNHFIF